MKSNKDDKTPSIAKLIRKEITYRILISILLIAIFGIFLSAYNTYNYLESIKERVVVEIEPLSNFIISQVLVSNPGAIKTALNEFNQENKSIKTEWIKNNMAYSKTDSVSVTPTLSWTYYHPLRQIEGNKFGYIKITGKLFNNPQIINLLLSQFLVIFIFPIVIIFLLLPISKKIPKKLLVEPINDILNLLNSGGRK